ncbi:hypothetical protein H5410_027378 [Solanum commersonii]|uniref:Uncharacterized protein n=1 Tax=Solanum commersonii TaxID=4109 RepID=A0A9J5Z4A3_SOLCO|nr:hypothetical protein H5410_027378 [Solanum commersonii]
MKLTGKLKEKTKPQANNKQQLPRLKKRNKTKTRNNPIPGLLGDQFHLNTKAIRTASNRNQHPQNCRNYKIQTMLRKETTTGHQVKEVIQYKGQTMIHLY